MVAGSKCVHFVPRHVVYYRAALMGSWYSTHTVVRNSAQRAMHAYERKHHLEESNWTWSRNFLLS
eukprot:1057999-Amphidinium_carterae.1